MTRRIVKPKPKKIIYNMLTKRDFIDKIIHMKYEKGFSYKEIVEKMNDRGFRNRHGKLIDASFVGNTLNRHRDHFIHS